MILALILATIVYTASDSSASDTACVAVEPLVSPLSHVTLWGWPRYGTVPIMLGSRIAYSGETDSIEFEDGGSVWTVWTVTHSTNGRVSCESQRMGVNLTTSVETQAEGLVALFDLSGRRVVEPKVPGVYFRRDARGVRRIVVLR